MRVGAKIRPPLLLYMPRYRRAKRRVFTMMRTLLDEHRAQSSAAARDYDLLHALLNESRADSTTFTDADIVATALYGFVGTLVYLNRVLAYLLYEVLKDSALRDDGHGGGRCAVQWRPRDRAGLEADADAPARLSRNAPLSSGGARPAVLRRGGVRVLRHSHLQGRQSGGDAPARTLLAGATTPIRTSFDCGRCADPRGEIHAVGAFAPFGFDGRVCAAAGLVEVISLATMADAVCTWPTFAWRRRTTSSGVRWIPCRGPKRDSPIEMGRPAHAADRDAGESPVRRRSWPFPPRRGPRPPGGRCLKRVERARYAAGTLIIREGDVAEHFFIVTEGEAEVFRTQGADDTTTRAAETRRLISARLACSDALRARPACEPPARSPCSSSIGRRREARRRQGLRGGAAARAAARAASSSCSVGNRSNGRSVGVPRRCLSKKSSIAVQSSSVNA